jgi:hypothetical protein
MIRALRANDSKIVAKPRTTALRVADDRKRESGKFDRTDQFACLAQLSQLGERIGDFAGFEQAKCESLQELTISKGL